MDKKQLYKKFSSLYTGAHDSQYIARSTALGLFIGLTPTVGLQVFILSGIWVLTKHWHDRLGFNLFLASAWTLVSNFITVPPLYYLYVVTGRIILGRWDKLKGFEVFSGRMDGAQVNERSLDE